MIDVILYEPEIAPNTGNIIRLCANSNTRLHLIEPLGFDWDDKKLRRAGMDYFEYASVERYSDFETFLQTHQNRRIWPCTVKTTRQHHQQNYQADDMFLFGPESRGLPASVLARFQQYQIRVPIIPQSRSLNLSNTVAIVVFEALRQLNYPDMA